MILEEIIGEVTFKVTRNGKSVQLKVGDTFTDDEYLTRTVYGDSGKVVIRVDVNCTVEIGAMPAPVAEPEAPKVTVKSTPAPTPAPTVDETPAE